MLRPGGNYDPFARGQFPVGVRTMDVPDSTRRRVLPCELWYPASEQYSGHDLARSTQDAFAVPPGNTSRTQMAVRDAVAHCGNYPLIVFSHSSGAGRRSANFLCTHLGSHGYIVAALDHSEMVAPELARREGETAEQKAERWQALMASRVPDVRLLLDHLLGGSENLEARFDPARVGIVGHSFGGWTALAAPDVEPRIRAVVALAPGGGSTPKPGILPAKLDFAWKRDVPTLFLAAENDASLPLSGMYEIFERTPATKQMVILRRSDHMHFMDNVEELHEAVRSMAWPGDLAWLPKAMLPITELCSGENAHLFVRGLTLCHLDAVLKQQEAARQLLAVHIQTELASRGVDAIVCDESHRPIGDRR